MPSWAHQRISTYALTAAEPTRIDLTTEYKLYAAWEPAVDPTPAVTGFSLTQARAGEAEISAHRLSLVSTTFHQWEPDRSSVRLWAEPKAIETLLLKTQGLIRIDGDCMTYIVSNPGGPRPASFDTTPGDGLTLVTLRRVR